MLRRIAELVAMVVIGDGVLALAAPRKHNLLWRIWIDGHFFTLGNV